MKATNICLYYHFCTWEHTAWCGWPPGCPDHVLYLCQQVHTCEHVTNIIETEEGRNMKCLIF